jgi:hypothetical protein
VKALVAMPKPGAVKLFAPLEGPSAVLDASLGAQSAGRFAVDPRVVEFLMEHLGATSFARNVMPTERGKTVLRGIGADLKALDPLLDGEVSAATHRQKVEPAATAGASPTSAANAPAGVPATATATATATAGAEASASATATATATDAAAQPPREVDGFTVIWHVSDAAKASAILDAGWKTVEATDRATKGQVKHPAPGVFDQEWRPNALDEHVRLVGSSLLVTTHPAMLDAATDAKPRATWMASAAHPTLKQLATIEGANGILAFDGLVWRRPSNRDLWGGRGSRADALRDAEAFGMLGLLGGGGGATPKGKKLEEQRSALQDQIRDLEKALDKHKEATWGAFVARLGTTALFAKPADGGVAIYGGLFTPEASVTALAEAALAAWMSVGPRWEKWTELTDLKKKLREIDDKLDGERQKAMDDLVGDVLRGVGASDSPGLGRGRWGGFDDDLGSLLDSPNGGVGGLGVRGTGPVGGATLGGNGTVGRGGGGLAPIGNGGPGKKP